MATAYIFDNELLGDNGDHFEVALVEEIEGTEAECLAAFAAKYGSNDYTLSFTAP